MKKSVLTGILLILLLIYSNCNLRKTVSLKIIETGDVHGSILPYDFIQDKEADSSLAQLMTYLNEQRAIKSQEVVLLDNGDILQGEPIVYYSNFEADREPHICSQVMNYMQYDAGAIGNHDIEPGHSVYDKIVKEFKFPWLSANIIDTSKNQPYFKPYAIIKKKGVKIAILGLTTPSISETLPRILWQGMKFEEMLSSARKWVKIIKDQEKPDLLIGLFHSGVDNLDDGQASISYQSENAAMLVAEQVAGFDIVFSAHDHKKRNETITNMEGGKVLLLGAAANSRQAAAASITMSYDSSTRKWNKTISGETIDVTTFAPDKLFIEKFQYASNNIKAYVTKKLGTFTQTISSRDAMFGDAPFVDMIHRIQLEITGADISFSSPLAFDTQITKGDILVRNMFMLYKTENLLYTIEMTGDEIKKYLEYSYGLWFNTMSKQGDHLILFKKDDKGKTIWSEKLNSYEPASLSSNYDSAAGILYTVDAARFAGQRVFITGLTNGEPFDYLKKYKVAVSSARATGSSGHLSLGAGISLQELKSRILNSTTKDLRYFLMKWIEKTQEVTPSADNNWKVTPESWAAVGSKMDYKILYEGFKESDFTGQWWGWATYTPIEYTPEQPVIESSAAPAAATPQPEAQ